MSKIIFYCLFRFHYRISKEPGNYEYHVNVIVYSNRETHWSFLWNPCFLRIFDFDPLSLHCFLRVYLTQIYIILLSQNKTRYGPWLIHSDRGIHATNGMLRERPNDQAMVVFTVFILKTDG